MPTSDAPGSLTIGELVSRAADAVGSRHEARWLCEVATGRDGPELEAARHDPATDRMRAHLDAMLARYLSGEPLAYVLGRWSFRTLDLAVDRRVLIPRPETELVAGTAIELARGLPSRRIADLGTGSGAIGLSVAAELPLEGTEVWVTDVSPEALAVAGANLVGIGRHARNVRLAQGSWYQALPAGARFDVIVSNPPYVAEQSTALERSVRDWEPTTALFAGTDGLDAIRQLVDGAGDRLVAGGWLVLEVGSDQGPAVRALMDAAGLVDVEVRHDLAGHDRIGLGRLP